MFNNQDLREKAVTEERSHGHMEKGSFGRVSVNAIPVKGEGRKPLFSKVNKARVENPDMGSVTAELRRMNQLLSTILQTQQRMEVGMRSFDDV